MKRTDRAERKGFEARWAKIRKEYRQAGITIAQELSNEGVVTPLKYRALYRDNFTDAGAARATDYWNYTTVKRIIKNEVYLGKTVLGKTRKVSLKSKKKISVPKEDWVVTEGTHIPLVDQMTFDKAQFNLGKPL